MARARIYLDTNVFIAAFEIRQAKGDAARQLLAAVDTATLEAVTSELTLAELLVKPLRDGDDDLAAIYRTMIAPNGAFATVPIHRGILEEAAAVRAQRPARKLPDAIHIATALHAGCSLVASADRALLPASPTLDFIDLDANAILALIGHSE